MTDEVPPWGTPDGEPAGDRPAFRPERGAPEVPDPGRSGGVPDYGTPPPAPDRHGRHRSGRGTPAPASGSSGPDLLGAEQIVVVEQGGLLSAGGYDLLTPDGTPLGSVVQETSVAGLIFGGAATTRYRLLDAWGSQVGSMLRPATIGRSRFVVSDGGGTEIGTVEQENSFGTPKVLLTPSAGPQLRLLRPFASETWLLTPAGDRSVTLGQVAPEFPGLGGMLQDLQRFAITLAPALAGPHRLLTVMATVSLDHMLDAKRR